MAENREGVRDAAVALAAARRLLRVDTRAEAAAVLHEALHELGGRVVDEGTAEVAAPVVADDVSLGVGPRSYVVAADGRPETRAVLVRTLPALLDDAHAAAARCDRYLRQATLARTD